MKSHGGRYWINTKEIILFCTFFPKDLQSLTRDEARKILGTALMGAQPGCSSAGVQPSSFETLTPLKQLSVCISGPHRSVGCQTYPFRQGIGLSQTASNSKAPFQALTHGLHSFTVGVMEQENDVLNIPSS